MTQNKKKWKIKNNKDMDYNNIIRHGGLGHKQFRESWPYVSNATPYQGVYHCELSHVKNEFSLLCMLQNENGQRERESVQKRQWVQV